MRTLVRGLAVLALLGGWAAPAGAVAPAVPAAGQTFTVNSPLDQIDADPADGVCASTPGGVCTLRAAIMDSNFVTGPNTITVPSGVYTLTRVGYDDGAVAGDLDLGHAVTILGAGSGTTIIDGNGAVTGDRVFQVLPTAQHVFLQGLTIRGGHYAGNEIIPVGGGGMYVEGGQLDMYDMVFEGNSADRGGALATADGVFSQVNLSQSSVYSNAGGFHGGGFFIRNGSLNLSTSQVYSNTAARGGGLALGCASASVSESTISGNWASGYGGGVAYECAGQPGLKLYNSTVSGNNAAYSGGGVYSFSPLTVVNSTISNNLAHEEGGGAYVDSGANKLYNATVAGNQVVYHTAAQPGGLGGGIFVTDTASLDIHNSILAGNTRLSEKGFLNDDDCTLNGGGGVYYYSLFGTLNYCGVLVQIGLIVGQDPLLGPLQDNGGPTPTRALLPGSPAIGAGDPTNGCTDTNGSTLLTFDQRGAHRPATGCDMGAYEVVPEADLRVSLSAAPSPARVGAPLTYTLLLTNTGPATASTPVLGDGLPISLTLAAVSASQGDCSGNVVCQPGALAAGARLTVTLVVTPTAAGWLTNRIDASNSEFDPVFANNTARLTVLVLRDLWLPLVRRN